MKNSLYMEKRPWGSFFVLSDEKDFKIKKIEVNPSKRLSYQFHYKRSELWYILNGVGIVTINDKKTEVKKGSIVKIKKLERHTVIYTDEYEMSDGEFKKLYSSKDDFLKKVQSEEIEEYKINSFVDDISNRDGTYEEDWKVEFLS